MKHVIWIGSSKKDLREQPKKVKTTFGQALMYAQCGEKHENTKILKGIGSGKILQVFEDTSGGTFRLVYTVKFAEAIVVLHVFQKKSKRGIETTKQDKDLIKARLQLAQQEYEDWLKSRER